MSLDRAEPDDGADTVRRCTRSDVAAQYARHHVTLQRLANSIFNWQRPDAAQDAVMQVVTHVLELVQRGELTDQGDGWEPYLRRAVRNRCLDIIRTEQRYRARFPEGDPDKQRVFQPDPLGDEVAERDQHHQHVSRLHDALASLSDRHADIIKLKFWNGWSDKKIGERLGISSQAVGQQLRTALKRLREEVTNDG